MAAALLYLVLREAPIDQVGAALAGADMGLVALGLLLNFVGLFIVSNRWQVLLASQRAAVPLKTLFESLLVAVFFNNFLPSTIGGDASRMYDSWKSGVAGSTSVAIVIMDRVLGLVALLGLAAIGAALLQESASQLAPLLVPLFAAVLASVTALVLLFSRIDPPGLLVSGWSALPARVRSPIATALQKFRGKPRALAIGGALSVLLQLNVVVFYFVLAQALSIAVPFSAFLLIVPLALLVMMLPISINAIGLREGAFAVLLGLYGVPASHAIALAWIAYALVLIQGGVGAILYTVRR